MSWRLLLALLVANVVATVAMFAIGQLAIGFACLASSFALLGVAARRAHSDNWTPADPDRTYWAGEDQ